MRTGECSNTLVRPYLLRVWAVRGEVSLSIVEDEEEKEEVFFWVPSQEDGSD